MILHISAQVLRISFLPVNLSTSHLLLSISILVGETTRIYNESETNEQQASMSWIHRIIADFSSAGTGTPPDIRKKWGYSIKWTPLHPEKEQQAEIGRGWDKLSDEALARLNVVRGKRDLYTTLKEEHETDDVLTKLWSEAHEIPEWVDWEQIERGQKVCGGKC